MQKRVVLRDERAVYFCGKLISRNDNLTRKLVKNGQSIIDLMDGWKDLIPQTIVECETTGYVELVVKKDSKEIGAEIAGGIALELDDGEGTIKQKISPGIAGDRERAGPELGKAPDEKVGKRVEANMVETATKGKRVPTPRPGNGVVYLQLPILSKQGIENIGVPYVLGDAELDGDVDAADLNLLGISWQSTGNLLWDNGNFNGDDIVNAADLNVLGINWQTGVEAAALPEPTVLTLLFTAALAIITMRRRR